MLNEDRSLQLTTGILFKALARVSIPSFIFFFYVWQSVTSANLSREIRKMTHKKEEMLKKNYNLKVEIASIASASRIETLYKKNNHYTPAYPGKKIITLTLPPEKKNFDLYANEP